MVFAPQRTSEDSTPVRIGLLGRLLLRKILKAKGGLLIEFCRFFHPDSSMSSGHGRRNASTRAPDVSFRETSVTRAAEFVARIP